MSDYLKGKKQLSLAEIVRQELAQRFYDALKATADGTIVTVDFSAVPRFWRVMIPTPLGVGPIREPVTINAQEWINKKLPGLSGYALQAGMENHDICTHCGKCIERCTPAAPMTQPL